MASGAVRYERGDVGDRPAEESAVPDEEAATGTESRDDTTLAHLACAGDGTALECLVARHQPAVTRLLWRFARNHADLEDLVQDTFLRFVQKLDTWEERQPLRHWLQRIATNVGRDYFRRQAVRRRWMSEPAADANDGIPAPEGVTPGADPAARAAANEVKAFLAMLAPDDRTVLTLRYLEGWSLGQIAERCGWTATATRLRAWRARRELRHLMETRPLS